MSDLIWLIQWCILLLIIIIIVQIRFFFCFLSVQFLFYKTLQYCNWLICIIIIGLWITAAHSTIISKFCYQSDEYMQYIQKCKHITHFRFDFITLHLYTMHYHMIINLFDWHSIIPIIFFLCREWGMNEVKLFVLLILKACHFCCGAFWII